ncbi:MAG: hypothetical protein ABI862_16215 [Ilumatobacteraceae bacterium]
MTNTTNRHAERQRSHRGHWIIAITSAVAVTVATVMAVAAQGTSSPQAGTRPTETNAMGMTVIANPGMGSGTAEVAGLTATPSTWELGRVKLNVAVRPTWKFLNTGSDTVTVGQPHVQINQGCCPGALTFEGPSTLTAGQSTNLVFELSMHPGMDGPHDMTLHVPVQHADGTNSTMDLAVTGDFRD